MPTNQNAYNSRLTDEALEKRFRDTFKSQGGAELLDDLYASGVIVPVVDFTSAAEGSALRSDLQQSWDFATSAYQVNNTTTTIANTPGFWKVELTVSVDVDAGAVVNRARLQINDGATTKALWGASTFSTTAAANTGNLTNGGPFVVFLRTGDSLECVSAAIGATVDVWTRQIADVYGNLTNPLGYTSS